MTMQTMLVAGAGALGSFLAARLATAGAQVSLLARGERLAQVAREGLVIAMDGQSTRVKVAVGAHYHAFPPPDLVVLACKAGDLPALLEKMASGNGPTPAFLTLQNGVEAPELVAQACPAATVLASRVHGFFELDHGVVRHVGVAPSITFGQFGGGAAVAADELARWLTAAGITHRHVPDVRPDLWEKFLLAAALGAVGSAYGMSAGQLLANDDSRSALLAAMKEVPAVAAANGVALPLNCAETAFAFVRTFPTDATTSLQRDLAARRPSEYDAIIGAVLRLAGVAGVPVPTFARLEGMIRARGLLAAGAIR